MQTQEQSYSWKVTLKQKSSQCTRKHMQAYYRCNLEKHIIDVIYKSYSSQLTIFYVTRDQAHTIVMENIKLSTCRNIAH